MKLHRLRVLTVIVLLSALSARVHAQQVFLERLWVHDTGTNCAADLGKGHFSCLGSVGLIPINPFPDGNISNEPHIEFDIAVDADCTAISFPSGVVQQNICIITN